MSAYNSHDYHQVADYANEVEAWLTSLGILSYTHTRWGYYRKQIERLALAKDDGQIGNFFPNEKLGELPWAISEVLELQSIKSRLGNNLSPEIIKLLKEILSGPALPSKEDPSKSNNGPRNKFFELTILAALQGCNLPLLESDICDACTEFEGRTIFIECKRPQTPTSINSVSRDGMSQLKERVKKHPNAIGILAISISKILNDGEKIFITKNAEDIERYVDLVQNNFVKANHKRWQQQASENIIGVIVHANLLGSSKEKGGLTSGSKIAVCSISPDPAEAEYLQRLVARFAQGLGLRHDITR